MRWVGFAILITLLGFVGLYGLIRPGLKPGDEPDVAHHKLSSVPLKIGLWLGVERDVRANLLRVAESQAHLSRDYTHTGTGEAVSVMILYGEPGPLCAHSPQVCYAGAGYESCGPVAKRAVRLDLPAEPTELWSGRFERAGGKGAIDVYWGWGVNGSWQAADHPRFAFADRRLIYKLYAQWSVGGAPSSHPAPDRSTDFLTPFLREVALALGGGQRR
jgi:Protein of unknown function (DUF3485)